MAGLVTIQQVGDRPGIAARPRLLRWILTGAGSICVGLAVVGLFLPLIPTVDFLLLAAICYANSSPKAHYWLHHNRLFGKRLRDYRERRGATIGTKAWTLIGLFASLVLTYTLIGPPVWFDALLVAVAAGVTVHVLRLKTVRD